MRKLTHEKFLEKLLQKNKHYADGDFIITSKYIAVNDPIGCHCNVHNLDWTSSPAKLYRGWGCSDCGRESAAKKIMISREEFVEKLDKSGRNFKLVGGYINETTPAQFMCKAGHIFDNRPIAMLGIGGCPYCGGRKILIGDNDMWTTRPDIAALLQDPEDGYRYTFGSNKSAWFVCPDCKTPSFKKIINVTNHGFGCQHCSDNISYPNKFSRALLDQLPIDKYDYEYQPEWAKPYYYDNHFCYNGVEYILEMDGYLHFNERTISRNTLKQIQEKDRIKDELAAQHNIRMIRIECIKSDMDYIKEHILSSELNNVFDLSNIDWELCDQKAQKNILKEACELYMSHTYTFSEIGGILHIHPTTVSKYLVKGAKFGWSNYVSLKSKAVVVIDNSGQTIHSFDSMAECNREMKRLYNITFSNEYLRKALETHELYHGFNFRFANELNINN